MDVILPPPDSPLNLRSAQEALPVALPQEEVLTTRSLYTRKEEPEESAPSAIQKGILGDFKEAEKVLNAEGLSGKVVGNYKMEKILGKGAMGVIYLAENIGLKKKVAVKILPHHLTSNPKKIKQFFREGRAAAKLDHPNIVRVHQVGEEQGIYYLEMEYIEGNNLKQMIRDKHFLEPEEAIEIFVQICKGLQCAHSYSIIHRDIKPENIMLKDNHIVKIADFGIAKQQDEEDSSFTVNEAGHLIGTPAYMSPEQIDGQQIDTRSDIYSMGVMFYYMLLGKEPHIGETPVKTLLKHLSEPLSFPENHGLPVSLVHLIEKMMAKRREERYSNIEETLNDLKQWKEGKSIEVQVHSEPLNTVLQKQMTAVKRSKPFALARWISLGFVCTYLLMLGLFVFTKPTFDTDFRVTKTFWEEAQKSAEALQKSFQNTAPPQRNKAFYQKYIHEASLLRAMYPGDQISSTLQDWLSSMEIEAKQVARKRLDEIKSKEKSWLTRLQHGLFLKALSSYETEEFPGEFSLEVQQLKRETQQNLLEKTGEIFILGGEFSRNGEKPLFVEPFYIQAYEVTNEAFSEVQKSWKYDPKERLLPASGMTWDEAQSFAQAKKARLPSEIEWEYAATGGNPLNLWSWGNEYFSRANLLDSSNNFQKKSEVQSPKYLSDKSPLGVYGMTGNVREWVQNLYSQEEPHPVFKGGCYLSPPSAAHFSLRRYATEAHPTIGFRLARSLDTQE
jgi:serine/threonine protein kinase